MNPGDLSTPEHREPRSLGVILLNMGGPIDQDAVKPFLYELFSDRELINFPFPLSLVQKPIAKIIAHFRSKTTRVMYQEIGGGSPIRKITESLAHKIQTELVSMGTKARSTVAMRYAPPWASDALQDIDGADTVVLFSQYPHFAQSTTGSSLNDMYRHMHKNQYRVIEIKDWGEEPEYIQWWVDQIQDTFGKLGLPASKQIHIVFSAHGLPMSYIKKGEKYSQRLEQAKNKIVEKLGSLGTEVSTHISYQSRAGPIEWTQPYTDDLLGDIAEQQPEAVIVVPLGFVSDHVETLYEIDIEYKHLATGLGIPIFERVKVPNDDDLFAQDMAKLILRRIEQEAMS